MKRIFQLIAVLMLSLNSFADCSSSGLHFWPTDETISENPVIMIEGYAMSQDIINKFEKKYPVYLKSKGHTVRLIPQEILKGDMSLTQALLKPEEALHEGVEYELYIKSYKGDLGNVQRKNPTTGEYESVKWKVEKNSDDKAPEFIGSLSLLKASIAYFGCGPAKSMDFKFKTDETSKFLVKTTLTNKKTNASTTYYLAAADFTASVGHGMCSGAFNLEIGTTYSIECSLIDENWNTGKSVSGDVTYHPTDDVEKG